MTDQLAALLSQEGCSHYRPGSRAARSFAARLIAAGVTLTPSAPEGLREAAREADALVHPAERRDHARRTFLRFANAGTVGELTRAIDLANRVLDRPSGDPDDDLALLSRQLLRLAATPEPAPPKDRQTTATLGDYERTEP